jgi:protein-disulfide isomerase
MISNSATSALAVLAMAVSVGAAGYIYVNSNGGSSEELAAASPAPAVEAMPQQATLERSDIESIVHEYLVANPEIMLEVQDALKAKQEAERLVSQQKALSEKHDVIFASQNQIEIGDAEAPITIVEFFDYNCTFCHRALSDMNRILDENGDIRFVLKEFPVLGEDSLQAHKVSIAFSKLYPEKAAEFHTTLLNASGRKNGDSAMALAEKLGGDPAQILSEIEKPYVVASIREVYDLADDLGITGTPSYVVGDEVVFGAVGFSTLNQKVASIKECGKATC